MALPLYAVPVWMVVSPLPPSSPPSLRRKLVPTMSASNGALVPKADPSVVPGHGSKASVLPSRTPAHNHNEATPESPTLPTAASHPGHGMLSSPPLLKHAGSEPFEPYGRDTEAVSSDSTVGNDESSGKPQHSPTMPFDFVAATEAINKNELHTSHSSPSAEDSPRKDGGFKQQSSSDASTISNVERHRGRGRDSSDEIPLEGMPDSKRVRIAEPPSTPTTVHGQVIDRASPKLSSQGSSEDTVRLSTNTSACSSDDVRSDLLSTHHDDLNPLNPPTEKRDSSMSSTPKSASSLSSDTSRALTRPFRPPTAGQSASSTTPTSDLSLSSPAKGSASRSFRLKRPTNFKAPNAIGVSCSSSSSGASSRRIGLDPTRAQINQLEARLRTLRLALRYQRYGCIHVYGFDFAFAPDGRH